MAAIRTMTTSLPEDLNLPQLEMWLDQRCFATEVEALAKALGLDATLPPLDFAAQIAKTVEKARTAQTARESASKRL